MQTFNIPNHYPPGSGNRLKKSAHWYEERERGLGARFIERVDESMSLILDNPQQCSLVYKNIRRSLIRRFPFGIFYIIEEDKIIIIAVFHFKRDPQVWRERARKQNS